MPTERRPDAITMSDIARRAGVARPTVSVVLNGRDGDIGISLETRERILLAAKELGYRRNALALAIKRGRTSTFGFLVVHADSEYWSRAFAGALDEADTVGYTIKRFRLHGLPDDARIVAQCSEQRLDGILVNDTGHNVDVKLIRREFESQGIPVVWLNPDTPLPWGVQISPDDEQGASLAVQHLLDLGHRRIAFLGGLEGRGTGVPRVRGFQRTLCAAGLNADLMRWCQWSTAILDMALEELMAAPHPPTGLLCGSDAMALLTLRKLRRLGFRVPGDVSVIGFGDLARVDCADPALTTVAVPYHGMGREAVRKLLPLVDTPHLAQHLEETLLPTKLVIRESTAPAP